MSLVQFSAQHQEQIAELISLNPTHEQIRDDISTSQARVFAKRHYVNAQARRCCYCKQRVLSSNLRMWDLEHIVPLEANPLFAFVPANLAAACPDCNLAKSATQTLHNRSLRRYPTSSAAYKIVHPHFDDYDTHISKIGVLYYGKTAKGRWTVSHCNLQRYAGQEIDWDSPISDERFEREVSRLLQGGGNAADALAIVIAGLGQRSL